MNYPRLGVVESPPGSKLDTSLGSKVPYCRGNVPIPGLLTPDSLPCVGIYTIQGTGA